MGGTWSAKLQRRPRGTSPDQLRHRLQAELDAAEADLSTYRPESPVSRFNAHRGTGWFDVPDAVAEVVLLAGHVSDQTGGAFDITVAPIVNLWGFGPPPLGGRAGEIPADAAIESARSHVDYRKLHVRTSPPALRKDDPELQIDLSAIGKGYAARRLVVEVLRTGVTDFLVAVGGELRASGSTAPGGRPWPVGIEVPTPDTRRILQSLELRDAALSTSGDYRNFVDIAGHRFSHEIDPRTGRPITGNLASISVVHADSAYADAMATALIVLGPDDGYALATRLDVAALFVARDPGNFVTRTTPAYDRMMTRGGIK
jgi:thiamine biosynthesis lipoprotein